MSAADPRAPDSSRGIPAEVAFAGPGELRARCRALAWAATPLGPVEQWPAALCSAAQIVLASGLPNILLWGRELVQIYNDAYAELIRGKHPYALGRGNQEVWPEVWHINAPIFERVFAGETVTNLDAHYPLERSGAREDVYLTVAFSPVLDDAGAVGGVLANMVETTKEVAARVLREERERLFRELEIERARLETVFAQAPAFLAVLRGPDHVFSLVNEAYCRLVGRTDLVGQRLFDALPEVRGQGFEPLMDAVLATGEPATFHEIEVRLRRGSGSEPETRYLDLSYRPLIEGDGKPAGIIAHGNDVTEHVLARRNVDRLLAAERAARARTEQLQLTAAQLSSARTRRDVARVTIEAGCSALGLSRGSVYALEPGDPPVLVPVHVLGYGPEVMAEWQTVPVTADSIAGDVVLRRAPVVLGDRAVIAARYPALRPLLQTTSYAGGAVFPLLAGDPDLAIQGAEPPTGFIAFDFDRETALAEDDVRFLAALAQLCAQALERARLFEAEHRARQTADRERLHLEGLIEALPVIVTRYQPALAGEPAAIHFNRAFTETLGWTEEDVRDVDLMTLACPDPDVRAAAVRHMQQPRAHQWLEIPTLAKDGRVVPILWTNVRLSDAMQIGVGLDLTERKAAEAAVEVERNLLRAVLDQMPVGVSIAEAPSGRLLYTNPIGDRLLGHPQHDVSDTSGYRQYGAMHEDGAYYAPEQYPMARALGGEFVDQHRMRYQRGDGRITHLAVSAAPVYDAEGRIIRGVGTFVDVSESVLLEEAMRRARAEAEAANRAKSEFLAAMSHELRTPLNAISGYVDLMQLGVQGPLSDAQAAGLERIRVNARHLTSLINDILQFAKFEAGAIELHVVPIRARDSLAELDTLLQPQIEQKRLRCVIGDVDPALTVLADADRVRQILLNLVGNAIKFTDADGTIAIHCDADAEVVCFHITDDGHGIPNDSLDRIFDPFIQLERHRVESSQQGVGLGLAISRELARRMHGDITVSSTLAEGSTFTLRLPRATG